MWVLWLGGLEEEQEQEVSPFLRFRFACSVLPLEPRLCSTLTHPTSSCRGTDIVCPFSCIWQFSHSSFQPPLLVSQGDRYQKILTCAFVCYPFRLSPLSLRVIFISVLLALCLWKSFPISYVSRFCLPFLVFTSHNSSSISFLHSPPHPK